MSPASPARRPPRRGGAHGGELGFDFLSTIDLTSASLRAGRMFQVLLVDDDPAIRFMLHFTLDRYAGLHVVAEAANGVDAVSLVERIRPDAVILGVQMPFMDGLTAAKLMKRVSPETKIVIFSAVTCPSSIDKGFNAGADLYLSKMTPPAVLADATMRLCLDAPTSLSFSA